MKLLHVIPYADVAYGGPNTALRQMTAVAVERGVDVHVAVTNAAGAIDLDYADGEIRHEDGAVFHYFQRQFPRGWFRAPTMQHWLSKHVATFDLLHLHVPFTAPFRMAAHAATKAGRPYVVTPHGLLDPWSLQQKSWKKRPYLRFLESENLARAALLHATSGLEANFVSSLDLGPPVRNLSLAVDTEVCIKSVQQEFSGQIRLLSIARIHPVKGLPVLFESLAALRRQGREVSLDLAGDGEPEYLIFLKNLSERMGIASSITWHGHVGLEEKQRLYDRADVFVLLSHHENFGLAAAEALAVGLPVIVSDQVGLAPDVEEFGAGFVVPVGASLNVVSAVTALCSNDILQKCSLAARRLAVNRYSTESFSHGLIDMYGEALRHTQ